MVTVVALVGVGLAGQGADGAIPVPQPPVAFKTAPEPPAKYVGQFTCVSKVPAGTAKLKALLAATYTPSSIGTLRGCSVGGRSEHKDGRALDFMLNVNNATDKAKAESFLNWLIGPDAQGNRSANGRRLGVMYVIWNRYSWDFYDANPQWEPYTGASPHTDHIHISLSWDGALGRSSFWTGSAPAAYDYGPCQVYIGEPVEPGPHYTRCGTPVQRPAQVFPRRWNADTTADVLAILPDGKLNLYPGTGRGTFAPSASIGHGWQAMSLVTPVGDLDKDGSRDLVARDTDGLLWLYRGNGIGGFINRVQIGHGWQSMDVIVGAGDVNLDGVSDLVTRRVTDGALLTYLGTGTGGVRTGTQVGAAPAADLVTAVGDWDGDAQTDLISRTEGTGDLLLYSGDGHGDFSAPVQIGHGWDAMSALAGPGDFNGDGKADIMARTADGKLMLYTGRGDGRFGTVTQVGHGWQAMRLVS